MKIVAFSFVNLNSEKSQVQFQHESYMTYIQAKIQAQNAKRDFYLLKKAFNEEAQHVSAQVLSLGLTEYTNISMDKCVFSFWNRSHKLQTRVIDDFDIYA